jgi:glutamyl-tRNA reductase
VNQTHVIAFNHHQFSLEQVGKLHIAPEERPEKLLKLKQKLAISELVYLSTCNRVELVLITKEKLNNAFINLLLIELNSNLSDKEIAFYSDKVHIFSGENAIRHLFSVASSLDSFVVGEREIITQVRNAFEEAAELKISGDGLRLIAKNIIATAKEVFTNTLIAHNPVSVVSLAYRKLKDLIVKKDARFLIIGAGQTNTNLCKYLKKHGYRNFTVFNRTFEKAVLLANEINGEAVEFENLSLYNKGFDVLITCTSSSNHIVDLNLYVNLLQKDSSNKIVIDLAIPYDVDPQIYKKHKVTKILVESLQKQADENIAARRSSISKCEEIINKNILEFKEMHRIRTIERVMQSVPLKVKEIRQHAVTNVFAKEIESLDDNGKIVLEKMIAYLEKKYISVPMKMAKEIFLEKDVA